MKTIYIVKGSSGDYEDTRVWNVKAFSSIRQAKEFKIKVEDAAKKALDKLQERRDEADVNEDILYPDAVDFKSKYDPDFDGHDYDVMYWIEKLKYKGE